MAKHLTNDEKRRIVELKMSWATMMTIVQTIKEEFHREWLWMQAIYNALDSQDEFLDATIEDELDNKLLSKTLKAWDRWYINKVNKAVAYYTGAENISELFRQALDNYNPTPVIMYKSPQICNRAYVFVWDLHYWRTTDKLKENWNKMMAQLLLDEDIDEYTFILMWDLIESPRVSGIHDSQVLDMDYLWIQQALWCVDMLCWWFESLILAWYDVKVWGLNWNHVRMSKERDWDPERIVGSLMYEMIKKRFPNMILDYSKDWVLIKDEWMFRFILAHWDNGFNRKPDIQILQALWEIWKQNIIASWHYHCSWMSQWNWYIRLQTPSLNENSEYEKNKFIAKSIPWYVVGKVVDWKMSLSFNQI